jgi:hypothetical protein
MGTRAAAGPIWSNHDRGRPVRPEQGRRRVNDRSEAVARICRHLSDKCDFAAATRLRKLRSAPHTIHANAWDRREASEDPVNGGRSRPYHGKVVHRTATDPLENYNRDDVRTDYTEGSSDLPERPRPIWQRYP